MSNNQKREGILGAITRPLGFYALALLIVESFLIIVLTKGNLDAQLQAIETGRSEVSASMAASFTLIRMSGGTYL